MSPRSPDRRAIRLRRYSLHRASGTLRRVALRQVRSRVIRSVLGSRLLRVRDNAAETDDVPCGTALPASALTAKAAASVDCLSRGRLVLGVGAGYLRAEFDALGVRFDDRGDLLDQALAGLHVAWAREPAERRQPALRPRPVQRPRPPIWIGGNSRRARRDVARYGDGWAPLMIPAGTASELGTQQDRVTAPASIRRR